MANYINFQPNDFFKSINYTGTGAAQDVAVGFKPDFTWIKNRTAAGEGHHLYDAVRGVEKRLRTDTNASESTVATGLTTFGTDGFTVGSNAGVNGNGNGIVAWNWKAGTTSGLATNGSTTQTPTAYSFSQATGVSIIKYTGGGSAGNKFAHGLGVAPQMVLVKHTTATEDWCSYHIAMGNGKFLIINSLAAAGTNSNRWNNTTADAVNVTLGAAGEVNGQNAAYIAYCFAPVRGYSTMGQYSGNAAVNGQFINCGFKPAFIMIKNFDASEQWNILYDLAPGYNPTDEKLNPSANNAQSQSSTFNIQFCANGFKINGNSTEINGSNQGHVYLAFAKEPYVSSNSKAATAR